MDIGSASAISSYNYQTAVQGGTQAQAVLQALTQAYSSSSADSGGADPLAALVGNANLGPLVSAIYTEAQAANPAAGTSGITGLASSQTFGGVDPSSATSLLASLGSPSSSGLNGFDAALGASSYLALASYQSSQNAAAAAASTPAAPPAGSDSTTMNAYIQQVLGASQAATAAATFNLLG
jgi:hypothetical protein